MIREVDDVLNFTGYHGCASKCGVTIYRCCLNDLTCLPYLVVVLTELADNTGTSVTNASEDLATLVRERYQNTVTGGLPVFWVEHYPAGPGRRDETYDSVCYATQRGGRYAAPVWGRLTTDQFLELTQQKTALARRAKV